MNVLGYPKTYLKKCIDEKEKNYATTGYYLISNQ